MIYIFNFFDQIQIIQFGQHTIIMVINGYYRISGAAGEVSVQMPPSPNEEDSVQGFCQSHRATILVAIIVTLILIPLAVGLYFLGKFVINS